MRIPLVVVLGLVALAVSYNQRMLDPLTSVIARETGFDVDLVVMLSPAFTLPYALGQPFLGPIADAIGKAKVLRTSMMMVLAASVGAYFATSYGALFGWRLLAGIGAGGIIPVGLALIADRTPVERRQVVLSHFMSVAMLGQLYVAPLSAWISRHVGWQHNFSLAAVMAAAALGMLLWKVPPNPGAVRRPFSARAAVATYRSIVAMPVARVCFATVFAEGILIFGWLPHVAPYLEQRRLGSALEAGYILASMGVGGLIYGASVSFLARRFTMFSMMRIGSLAVGAGIAGVALSPSWQTMAVAYAAIGLGFYMLHSGIQARVTELRPDARASCVSLHAFSMFIGVAAGPPVFGLISGRVGMSETLAVYAVAMAAAGIAAARFLARSGPA